MKLYLGLFLLVCCGMLHLGSGLHCYHCSDHTGPCQDVEECLHEEDSCISLSESGGKTVRRCISFSDCDISRLTQMFSSTSGFSYRCCSSNLCNGDIDRDRVEATDSAPPARSLVLTVAGSLLTVWWFWV